MYNLLMCFIFVQSYHYCQTQCIESEKISLVKLKRINEYKLMNCVEINYDSPYVSQILNTCQFIQFNESFQSCAFICMTHPDCLAMLVTETRGCEHCLRYNSFGRSISEILDITEISIRVDMLENHINGKDWRFKLLIIHTITYNMLKLQKSL